MPISRGIGKGLADGKRRTPVTSSLRTSPEVSFLWVFLPHLGYVLVLVTPSSGQGSTRLCSHMMMYWTPKPLPLVTLVPCPCSCFTSPYYMAVRCQGQRRLLQLKFIVFMLVTGSDKQHGFFPWSSFYFFNSSSHSILFCVSFRCTAWRSDNQMLHKVLPGYFQYPPGTIHGYYSVVDYIFHAVLYIPTTILSLRTCTSQSLTSFIQWPNPSLLWQSVCSLCLWDCFCFVWFLKSGRKEKTELYVSGRYCPGPYTYLSICMPYLEAHRWMIKSGSPFEGTGISSTSSFVWSSVSPLQKVQSFILKDGIDKTPTSY